MSSRDHLLTAVAANGKHSRGSGSGLVVRFSLGRSRRRGGRVVHEVAKAVLKFGTVLRSNDFGSFLEESLVIRLSSGVDTEGQSRLRRRDLWSRRRILALDRDWLGSLGLVKKRDTKLKL